MPAYFAEHKVTEKVYCKAAFKCKIIDNADAYIFYGKTGSKIPFIALMLCTEMLMYAVFYHTHKYSWQAEWVREENKYRKRNTTVNRLGYVSFPAQCILVMPGGAGAGRDMKLVAIYG